MNVNLILEELPSWTKYVEEKASRLMIARRFDISAKGTNLLFLHSDTPVTGASVVWNVTGLDVDDSKIMALWFNSTFSILQVLLDRSETRGAWIEVSKYMLEAFSVPNIRGYKRKDRKMLLMVFDEVKNVKFPSILDQLRNKHPPRRLIDAAWLKVLGYKGHVDSLLDRLYDSLANEIELLKRLMAEGEAPEEQEEESE